MSSAPPSTYPSAAEIENLGVLFVGFVVATVLYGLTFFQTYTYYSRYPKDIQWIKYLVATLCVLDTAASTLVSEVLYYYLIILFDVDTEVLYGTTTFCVQYMLSVLLTFIPQLYFVHRVFQVTGRSKPVTVLLIFLSSIALVFGLTSTAQMFVQRNLSAFGSLQMETTAVTSQLAAVIADTVIFAMMCHSLRRARYPEMVAPEGFLEIAAAVFVGRGLAFTIVQMAYFCVFVAAPSRPLWVPLQMVTCKVYVNTLLGHLNSREIRQGRGLNEEDSLVDRKVPTSGRLPSSIRFNVSDVKATTQSVNFNTRHTDTESEGAELESRKTFQDQEGNEYTQVSTGSSQSQADNELDKKSLSEGFN